MISPQVFFRAGASPSLPNYAARIDKTRTVWLTYWPMVNALKTLSANLARNIAALRASQGMTQGDLSKRAGVPRSTITHLEAGSGNPSLANLDKVASAFSVTIEELLARPRADCMLVKAGDLRARRRGGVNVVTLLPDPVPGLTLERMELAPKARLAGIPHLSGTKEYFTPLVGRVEIYVAGENFVVEEGDVLAFPGDQAHSYRNLSDVHSTCLSVVALAPHL